MQAPTYLGRQKRLRNFASDNKQVTMTLPNDPMMLFSVVNTKLRDEYHSLDALCQDMGVDKETIEQQLAQAGFEYNAAQNKFW